MDRLQKKCFIASCGMHGVLFLVVLFGAAFFTAEKPPPVGTLTMIPTKFFDNMPPGGGGNPNIPRTDARIKGETLEPVPPKPPQPVKTEVPKPKVEPKPDVAKAEPPPKTIPKQAPIELRPVSKIANATKPKTDPKAKAQADAKAAQKELAKAIGQVRENMRQGFTSGTAVEVSGPGGEAYASYRSFVFAAYDNAWTIHPDVANDESAVLTKIVVHRTGRIISAEIVRRSGNVAIDKSVQRALDTVRSLPPFPEAARDQERTFTIEFNLKAKRLIG
jgi:periplasmic protein TonB